MKGPGGGATEGTFLGFQCEEAVLLVYVGVWKVRLYTFVSMCACIREQV